MTDLEQVRVRFRAARCRHVVFPDVVTEERAAAMRADVDAARFETYYEPDRGRYEIDRELVMVELVEELRELVEHVVESPLRIGTAHWLRLRRGDYSLVKDDAKRRMEAAHVEVTLDFSARATEQGEIVYTDGLESWVVPQLPNSVAVVAREPWLYRYERYLNMRVADAVIYRMRLVLER